MKSFQDRVADWMLECFGAEIASDTQERNHRFLEEALELVQACGATQSEAHQLVDYVYGRTVGEKRQEVGGVMVTLAALCGAQGMDMHAASETELARIWTKVEKIRAKQAAKPKHSPLPEAVDQQAQAKDEQEMNIRGTFECPVCGDSDIHQHPAHAICWKRDHRDEFIMEVKKAGIWPPFKSDAYKRSVTDPDNLQFYSDQVQALWLMYCHGVLKQAHAQLARDVPGVEVGSG